MILSQKHFINQTFNKLKSKILFNGQFSSKPSVVRNHLQCTLTLNKRCSSLFDSKHKKRKRKDPTQHRRSFYQHNYQGYIPPILNYIAKTRIYSYVLLQFLRNLFSTLVVIIAFSSAAYTYVLSYPLTCVQYIVN